MSSREKRRKRKREPSPTPPVSRRSWYALARAVPVTSSPESPPARFTSLEAVGSNIYSIATPRSLNAFPRFSILDCMSHTWVQEAPALRVELHSFSASVVDHKIYVAGHDYRLNDNSFQVFKWYDTERRSWRDLQGLAGLPKITATSRRYRGGKRFRLKGGGGATLVRFGGKFEWFDQLLKTRTCHRVDKVLSTTL
ncbi:F-box/kelch-repeat protein [Raphanus sativus]|nr:F-box/kelch-repeat protein [Raphanus sativus]